MGFREKVAEYLNSERRRSIEIKLPNGEKEIIYFMPMTVGDWARINLVSQGDNASMQVWTMIEKVENENGSKCFSAGDKPFLEGLDASIVTQITGEILKLTEIQEVKKN